MSESFELKVPETVQVPKESLIRVIAKTLGDTLHPGDPEGYSHRVFTEEELTLAARSLALKPITLNHQETIPDAIVVNADWNPKDKVVEAILSLPKKFKELVQNKEISKVSVEYIWDSVQKLAEKSVFKGLKFIGISLLQGVNAGDPNAKILFESASGRQVLEVTPTKNILNSDPNTTDIIDAPLGEPFAGYTDFADCVAKNQDKNNPEAYCGAIKAQVETEIKLTEAVKAYLKESAEDIEAVKKKLKEHTELTKQVQEKTARITELETAVQTATQATETLKTSHDKDVKDAEEKGRNETKKEIIKDLEQIIVPSHVESRFKQVSAKLLNTDIKRLKRKLETNGTPQKP